MKFQIATDRRDALDRATHIVLLDESFAASGEKREQGVVASLKEGRIFVRNNGANIHIRPPVVIYLNTLLIKLILILP